MNTPDLIGAGIQALVEQAKRLGLTWDVRQATVTNGENPAAVLAILDGDTQPIGMVSTIGSLLTDARVYVVVVPPAGNFIFGIATLGPIVNNVACTNIFGMSAGTTTSATFVTMPGTPTVALTKSSPNSGMKIDLAGTFFSTVASAGLVVGVSLDVIATDETITAVSNTNSSLGNHTTFAGHILLDAATVSMPAGAYTLTGIWRRSAGTGTLNVDSGDVWSCCVEEVI